MAFAGDRSSNSSPSHPRNGPTPLVIVSERGRHTDESRRIVRAQAARASAAQSRVTRARNRSGKDVWGRETIQSPPLRSPTIQDHAQFPLGSDIGHGPASFAARSGPEAVQGRLPLIAWLPSVLGGAAGAIANPTSILSAQALTPPPTGSLSSLPRPPLSFQAKLSGEQSPSESGKFQLPLALPRGFAALQQRIPISDTLTGLLSRAACVDFGSPGVENRLHELLFDLIVRGAELGLAMPQGPSIQKHLRIACTCLTIFQGQRANGAVFAQDQRYQIGLEAAWSEATLLDQEALAEPKSAEASLWAVFIISVTTGATANFFHRSLYGLLRDLQLRYWEQVRRVLLDFIYPVSFLDEPCKHFYDSVLKMQVAAG
ncbi:hypothetical protein B0A50_07020 [Salinomyces thailandicus]|uniref:Uncharacterized protein n=1 Tax=Salinomyces thailandicus TaxID=706561 RepID=A0A4U0TQ54_9PEZI|nr:hypothetical protein B0A50_07020 [Salinomyces thailandica]